MTSTVQTARNHALRRAAVRATYAPSVHNTQPWTLHLRPDALHIDADRGRQLRVLDPTTRQLTISVGCALFNARVALAGQSYGVRVDRFPRDGGPDRMATLVADETRDPDPALAALDPVLEVRRTNRRQFADDEVPEDVLTILEEAAAAEDSVLVVLRNADQRRTVAALSQRADEIENLNPAYRAELRAWTSDDVGRRDGVPSQAVAHVTGEAQDDIPIRDFDTRGTGGLPSATYTPHHQTLALLCTYGDSAKDWLRAGEALERVLLEITRHGFSASPLTQVTEVPSARARLRSELGMGAYPHVLLRIGRAPVAPGSRRRRLVDVLFEET